MSRHRIPIFLAALLGAALLLAAPCRAKDGDPEQIARMKAGFIYHLAKLVTWQESRFEDKAAPMVVGFLGEPAGGLAEYFESQASSYTAQGRKMAVKRFTLPSPKLKKTDADKIIRDISACHILYVPEDQEKALKKFPELLNTPGLLVVGETKLFTQASGMVGLEVVKGRFRILVNLDTVKRADLKISAQFLQHAVIVKSRESKN